MLNLVGRSSSDNPRYISLVSEAKDYVSSFFETWQINVHSGWTSSMVIFLTAQDTVMLQSSLRPSDIIWLQVKWLKCQEVMTGRSSTFSYWMGWWKNPGRRQVKLESTAWVKSGRGIWHGVVRPPGDATWLRGKRIQTAALIRMDNIEAGEERPEVGVVLDGFRRKGRKPCPVAADVTVTHESPVGDLLHIGSSLKSFNFINSTFFFLSSRQGIIRYVHSFFPDKLWLQLS